MPSSERWRCAAGRLQGDCARLCPDCCAGGHCPARDKLATGHAPIPSPKPTSVDHIRFTTRQCTATNIDAVGADGRTALHIAAAEGQLLAVHALMSAGAGLDTCDSRGQLPLETAREAGHAHIVAALAAEQAKRDAVWRQITGAGSGAGAGCAGGLQDRMLSDLLAAKSAAGPSAAGSQECPF